MKRKRPLRLFPGLKTLGGAFLLAAVLGPGAKAYDLPLGTQRLGVEAGAAYPTSVNGFSSSAKTGPTAGFSYLQEYGDFLGAGVQADYFHFGAKEQALKSAAGGEVNTRSQEDIATLEIIGRYFPLPLSRFKPYFQGGTGATFFRQRSTGRPLPGFTWENTNTVETRRLLTKQSVGLAFSIGAGVETNLSPTLILGMEAAWHVFEVDRSAFGTRTLNVPSLSVVLSRRFGQEPGPASN